MDVHLGGVRVPESKVTMVEEVSWEVLRAARHGLGQVQVRVVPDHSLQLIISRFLQGCRGLVGIF